MDKKRPFIYMPRTQEEIIKPSKPQAMEVNKMLDLVKKYFPPETGLYKKGAIHDASIALLFFTFPKMAEKVYHAWTQE